MGALDEAQIQQALAQLNAYCSQPWSLSEGALCRRFTFESFSQAFAFMSNLAGYAEEVDHHPDWRNCYRQVDIRLTSFDVKGISERDFDFAMESERVARELR